MSKKKKNCDLTSLVGKQIDPYSKDGKDKINKTNCYLTSIATEEGTLFFLGDKFSKEVTITKGYFGTVKEFDEIKNSWRSSFGRVQKLQKQKVLITDGSGSKQNGLLISPERGGLISRTLDKIQMMNDL